MEKNDRYNKLMEKAKLDILNREAQRIAVWHRLKHFETPDDVPQIPQVPKEEYEEFYVPKLIEAGAIRKKDLIDQQIYIGSHRRCTIAKWDTPTNKFMYWRNKFGCVFIETCCHFEDDDGYALFVPIKLGTEKDFEKSKDCLRKK
jgi:hypothetical protein